MKGHGSPHARKRCKRAALLYVMAMPNPYVKPYATPEQRVAHLRAKGLGIKRPNVAARKIEQIGYERLRIYFLSRRVQTLVGKPFIQGTTYNQIIRIYECDIRLRDACSDAVGRFEILFRNRISEVLSLAYGSHPYFDPTVFADAKQHNEVLQKTIQVYSQSKDGRAKHYQRIYTHPSLPPIWMMKEFLTFGVAARFYAALASSVRTQIANGFGISSLPVFDSWIPCFVDLRNICAHHDRLFNKRFQKQPQRFLRAAVPTSNQATLKAQLECLDHVLTAAGANQGIVAKVERILARYPEIRLDEAGY